MNCIDNNDIYGKPANLEIFGSWGNNDKWFGFLQTFCLPKGSPPSWMMSIMKNA